MYFVTCRNVLSEGPGPANECLGKELNERAPDNLRAGEAWLVGDEYYVKLYPDEDLQATPSAGGDDELKEESDGVDAPKVERPRWPSERAYLSLVARANLAKSPITVVVHGCFTNPREGLEQAAGLQAKYGAECVPFLWPANGRATPWDYRSDKADAEISAPAFGRFLAKAALYHTKHSLVFRGRRQECRVPAVTLVAHSMGCYLLKLAVLSENTAWGPRGLRRDEAPVFDNIAIVGADVNSWDHLMWVDDLAPSGSVFITSNPKDKALLASDVFPGEKQLARLGQTVEDAEPKKKARVYVEFDIVEPENPREHGYHTVNTSGGPIERFFSAVMRGERFSPARFGAELDIDTGCYVISSRAIGTE